MNIPEFKAWFRGFKENVKKPTEAQWKRVCEEIEKMEEAHSGALRLASPLGAVKLVPGDPATDPRFTSETLPKKVLSTGAAMDAGVPKK